MHNWTVLSTEDMDIHMLTSTIRKYNAIESGSIGRTTFYGIDGGYKLAAYNHNGATYTVTLFKL
jgi:hypothetical protein